MSEPGTFVGGFDNPNAKNAERYWEERWRDEKAENERLRGAIEDIVKAYPVASGLANDEPGYGSIGAALKLLPSVKAETGNDK